MSDYIARRAELDARIAEIEAARAALDVSDVDAFVDDLGMYTEWDALMDERVQLDKSYLAEKAALISNFNRGEGIVTLTVEAHVCDQRFSYMVTFEGKSSEEIETRVVEWMRRKLDTHAFFLPNDDYIEYPGVTEVMFPHSMIGSW